MTAKTLAAAALLLLLAGCQDRDQASDRPLLTGRAILPAATFADGPPAGHELPAEVNGLTPPFPRPPVQGFSSLVALPDGAWLALQDNGFGSLANSPDVPLRWYLLRLDLDGGQPHGGPVTLAAVVDLTDPDGKVPFPLADPAPGRKLCGADFDPESCVRLDDGTLWVGEEFGPSLLHFAADGRLLDAPVPLPVTPALRPHGGGSYLLRSPDSPDLRFGPPDGAPDGAPPSRPAEERANLPRSGGAEGLARNRDGSLLYVAVEKALAADPDRRRRSLLEFDPARARFTGRFWFYRTEADSACLTSLEAFTDRIFLVLERDAAQGAAARLKRVYRIDLQDVGPDGFLRKRLVCDLLDIRDSRGFSAAEEGAVGLGPDYSFPYVTPESLAILDDRTLLVANDNNFPFSAGRRPGRPDDNEFIRVRLAAPLAP